MSQATARVRASRMRRSSTKCFWVEEEEEEEGGGWGPEPAAVLPSLSLPPPAPGVAVAPLFLVSPPPDSGDTGAVPLVLVVALALALAAAGRKGTIQLWHSGKRTSNCSTSSTELRAAQKKGRLDAAARYGSPSPSSPPPPPPPPVPLELGLKFEALLLDSRCALHTLMQRLQRRLHTAGRTPIEWS